MALPASLTLINSGAFHTTKIESIDIPEGVEIGSSVFSCCYNLKPIKLPQSLTVIRGALLSNCMSLTEITIPESVTAIEKEDFYGCKLTSPVLPAGLKTIGNEAFAFCSALTDVRFSNSLKKIDSSAFYDTKITSVVEIADYAFHDSADLEIVTFDGVEIEMDKKGYVFSGCPSLKTINVPVKKLTYYKRKIDKDLHGLLLDPKPSKPAKKAPVKKAACES